MRRPQWQHIQSLVLSRPSTDRLKVSGEEGNSTGILMMCNSRAGESGTERCCSGMLGRALEVRRWMVFLVGMNAHVSSHQYPLLDVGGVGEHGNSDPRVLGVVSLSLPTCCPGRRRRVVSSASSQNGQIKTDRKRHVKESHRSKTELQTKRIQVARYKYNTTEYNPNPLYP